MANPVEDDEDTQPYSQEILNGSLFDPSWEDDEETTPYSSKRPVSVTIHASVFIDSKSPLSDPEVVQYIRDALTSGEAEPFLLINRIPIG